MILIATPLARAGLICRFKYLVSAFQKVKSLFLIYNIPRRRCLFSNEFCSRLAREYFLLFILSVF